MSNFPEAHSSLQILLAEDNPVNQQVALLMLKQLGCTATIATNGLEVLEALQQQAYDLILMDVQMPYMDGMTAARQIKQAWASHQWASHHWVGDQCPHIIAMTASLLMMDDEFRVAMDGYISKPIQLEELEAAIHHCSLLKQERLAALSDQLDDSWLDLPNLDRESSYQVAEPVAPLDFKLLENLRRSMGESASLAIPQLIDCYLTEAPKQIEAMQQAISQGDATGIKQAAHTLRSSSRALGATTLFDLCKTLEEAGQLGILDRAAKNLLALRHEFERFKVALEQERQ